MLRDSNLFTSVRLLDVVDINDEWDWKDVFIGMPNLRVLCIHNELRSGFSCALRATVDESKKNMQDGTLVVPKLRALRLKNVRLSIEFMEEMYEGLAYRHDQDVPLQELHLTEMVNITSDDVEYLKEVVPDVRWDGVVNWETSEESEDDSEDDDDDDSEEAESDAFEEDPNDPL